MRHLLNSSFVLAIILMISGCINEETLTYNPKTRSSSSTAITIEDAREDLLSLMADLHTNENITGGSSVEKIVSAYTIPVKKLTQGDDDEIFHIHIFNFTEDKGYAIMSGDTRIPSLLAYATQGNLALETVIDNPGFEMFIRGLDIYIKDNTPSNFTSAAELQDDYVVYGEWENIIYREAEGCKVKWGQNHPYNMFCSDDNGNRAATGCTATAIAQFMSVYKHPKSYNDTAFDWEAMTAYPQAFLCSTNAQLQIARLMKRLGDKQNLNTSYGSQSGADRHNIPRTLKAFGFKNSGKIINYSTSVVIPELQKGNPIIIAGNSIKKEFKILGITFGTSYSGGHVWLLHGLLERKRDVLTFNLNGSLKHTRTERAWYPLCNWGWDGRRDGYYFSGAFDASKRPNFIGDLTINENPSDNYSNYQYHVQIISDVRP